MMRLRRIVHRRRSSNGSSSVVTLTVPKEELQILTTDVGVAPAKTGVLLKYTNVLKRWKHRVFVLENGVLIYSAPAGSDMEDPDSDSSQERAGDNVPVTKKKKKKIKFLRRVGSRDEKERDIKGSINLQFAVISADDADPTRFAIDVGNDVYHIRAESEAERDEWVSALNASNEYFRALIKKAVSRAQERENTHQKKRQDRKVQPLPDSEAVSANANLNRKSSDLRSDSEESILEDDGLKEAEESRKALISELQRVHGLWRAKWVDDGTIPGDEKDFMLTLCETFQDPNIKIQSSDQSTRDTAKGLIDLVAWCLHVMQTNDEIFDRRLKADITRMMAGGLPVFPTSPSKAAGQPKNVQVEDFDSDSDSDAEFFDALSRAASSARQPFSRMSRLNSRELTFGETPDDPVNDSTIPGLNSIQRVDTKVISRGFRGRRTALPKLQVKKEKLNIFGLLKDNVGKELTKVSMPVTLNEPTSFLQRLAEDIEYSELLDRAAAEPDANRRMLYVATCVISHYSSTQGRIGKPFNPLLGETACVIMPDKGNGVRFIAEQVSHHPPISTCYAEGSEGAWNYHNAIEIKNKFWGKSLEFFPSGLNHVEIPKYGDHFVYEQVTSCVHNIVVGRLWLDNYGEMEIVNRTNGGRCVINFNKTGWMSDSKSFGAIKGTVYDANGIEKIKFGGNWTKSVYEILPNGKKEILWKVDGRPEEEASQYYNMTKWAISLNAPVTEEEAPHVAPTDSRFRPDQRALENGEFTLGSAIKARLEEGQRKRRTEREEVGKEWEPLWFRKITDPVHGVTDYEFTGEYFRKQAVGDWTQCPDIYSCAAVDGTGASSSSNELQ